MTIAITGTSGNMGGYFLWQLNMSPAAADNIKILCRNKKKAKKILKHNKAVAHKIQVVYGGLESADACRELIKGCDIVFNICAVIPPKSDGNPKAAIACNVTGVKNLLAAIEEDKENQPALVHISSVAVYGNRCGAHKYGRVGEPLVSGPFELYSATKILGEYAVLQSNVKVWAVLRQTAMLHYNIFKDNVHDGLMFHTPVDAPLEWATVRDSGRLLLNLLKTYSDKTLPEKFWKKVYNIGGGAACRTYGYGTYDEGFKIIGGSFKNFFKPWYNATRNFHGMWYFDSDELENYFHFRGQSCTDFWQEMKRRNKIYTMGKFVPRPLISAFLFKRLLNDANSPSRWVKKGDGARALAYFGGSEKFYARKKLTWKDVELPVDIPEPVYMTSEENIEAYGYDIDKADRDITVNDLIAVAEAHGGKCLTPEKFNGDMYENIDWETCDGEKFTASVYTVLRAGHWVNPLYTDWVWDFDRLSKTDRIFARIWYDSHEKDEDVVYYFDKDFKAHADKLKKQ
ncbi:MAG: NAD-dependent epimerase/dehydratase family protein [Roseburia sp.]|nr:NAD-dependent epimerase/dehydratase family protein [Roseburia sp.]